MQDHLIHWLELAGTGVDALLLVRFLALRLHRLYLFVTLYCAVTLLVDIASIAAGLDTPASLRVFLYSKFIMALVFPLAIYDLFEEAGTQVHAWRNAHAIRLASGLLLVCIFALLLGFLMDTSDAGPMTAVAQSAFLVWAATISACFMFLWNMRRLARRENVAFTANTFVLWVFFLITIIEEVCGFILMLIPGLSKGVMDGAGIALQFVDMAVIFWCIVKLRGLRAKTEAQTEP